MLSVTNMERPTPDASLLEPIARPAAESMLLCAGVSGTSGGAGEARSTLVNAVADPFNEAGVFSLSWWSLFIVGGSARVSVVAFPNVERARLFRIPGTLPYTHTT